MTRELPSPVNYGPRDDDGDVRVLVASQAFAEFSLWIEQQLEVLEGRWLHRAAPGAGKPRRKMPQTDQA